jgi:hypothetical protein
MASYEMGAWSNEDPFGPGTDANHSLSNGPTSPIGHADPNRPASPGGSPDRHASHSGPAGPTSQPGVPNGNTSVHVPFLQRPARPLNSRDVGAFIVNKMIGTGIFITPPIVLLLTRSKGEALGLWVLGFVYTLIRFVYIRIPLYTVDAETATDGAAAIACLFTSNTLGGCHTPGEKLYL